MNHQKKKELLKIINYLVSFALEKIDKDLKRVSGDGYQDDDGLIDE